jgi:hypothetical protein
MNEQGRPREEHDDPPRARPGALPPLREEEAQAQQQPHPPALPPRLPGGIRHVVLVLVANK